MRIQGNPKVVSQIEEFIKKETEYKVVKDKLVTFVGVGVVEPSLITHRYLIYVIPYEFLVRLKYDFRDNKGTFEMPDYNSQVLFIKYPQLSQMLSNLKSMLYKDERKMMEIPINNIVKDRFEHARVVFMSGK